MAISVLPQDDLQSYFVDLSLTSHLSSQEEDILLSNLRLARQGLLSPEQERLTKHRLIEGYLYLVIKIARQQQRLFRRLSLSDLVQEGNIGLLQAVDDYDVAAMRGCFFAYATACIRNAMIRALPQDSLICVPRCEFWQLAKQGLLRDLERSQPSSLDATNDRNCDLYDILAAPPVAVPVFSNGKNTQVDQLLSGLTIREQTVLRLLYGLDETDGRTLTRKEIASLLGLTPRTVRRVVVRAVRKLRSAPKDTQPSSKSPHQQGTSNINKQAQRLARRAEQEVSLMAAYARLEAQGRPITMLTLAHEAQVGTTIANAYLCKCWGTVQQRLEKGYTELISSGATITVERLAKTSRVSERAASDFIHVQRGTTRVVRPRHKTVQRSQDR